MERYSRQIILPEIGLIGQEKIAAAKVLVVGAGGLGCPVLQYLAAAGVGTIGIADGDVVSASNLNRQVLYTNEDIGKAKVECAKARLKAQNPEVEIADYNTFLSEKNAREIIAQYDIVVDGTDQIPVRYLLNDVCVELGKPMVYGAIHKFEGQVSVFNFNGGPSYRDLFPEQPATGSIPSCAENGVLGILPGMVGIAQATEVLKIIAGFGGVLSGKLWVFNAKTMQSEIIEFGVSQSAERFRKEAQREML
jgi:adenylyltransferase/sulfurtransferase